MRLSIHVAIILTTQTNTLIDTLNQLNNKTYYGTVCQASRRRDLRKHSICRVYTSENSSQDACSIISNANVSSFYCD